MAEPIESLERRIESLRTAVRKAAASGDRGRAGALRAELRQAEKAWDEALERLEAQPSPQAEPVPDARSAAGERSAPGAPAGGGRAAGRPAARLLPIREQTHQALTLLGVPAAPRLLSTVHQAFFAGTLAASRLASLRRDEERSFRLAPYARPYYLCAALTADLLAPARGLLAVSTWPMEKRVIGPLSPRVDYLTAAIAVAERLQRGPDPGRDAARLLGRFAVNIPGAAPQPEKPGAGAARHRAADPQTVTAAARAELEIHAEADAGDRAAAARRAREQLDAAGQLFGIRLRAVPEGRAGG